ncbi:MAG: transposase [Rhizobiaceae bacterium]|nr:transposase [Rhizobiaceae bacterium]
MALPHSDAFFIKAYPAETIEAFCDGHNAAFAFFGGVPLSILYGSVDGVDAPPDGISMCHCGEC